MRNRVIEKARTHLGYVEGPNNGTIFGSWYGLPNQPWCAMFVSYVMNEAGVSTDIVPKFASCTAGVEWFKERNLFRDKNYTPKKADIVFIDWDYGKGNGVDHVGIVESVDGDVVHTIEGNHSDKVERYTYRVGSNLIYGYGVPEYISSDENNEEEQTTNVERKNR